MPLYEIVTLVKERRTFVVEATDLDSAVDSVLSGDETARSVDVLSDELDEAADVTESYRDPDADDDEELED